MNADNGACGQPLADLGASPRPAGLQKAGRRRLLVALFAGTLLLYGCGSSSAGTPSDAAASGQGAQAQDAGTSASSGQSAKAGTGSSNRQKSDPGFVRRVSITASDQGGDRVALTIGVGKPTPADSVDNDAVKACANTIEAVGSSLQRSVAVPVSVGMKVLSSQGTDVVAGLGTISQVTSGGGVTLPPIALWAATYGDGGPQCTGPDQVLTSGFVHWAADAAQPGKAEAWSAYMVFPNAISPNDPDGSETSGRILISPTARLAGNIGIDYKYGSSTGVVRCSANDPALGTVDYVAIDPNTALANGCTGADVNPASATPATTTNSNKVDNECPYDYPDGIQVSDHGATYYDYRSSVYEVACDGFGFPEDLQLTQGMRCALFAAAATFAGPSINIATDRLCDANSIIEAYNSGSWLGAAGGKACDVFNDFFSGAVAVFTAGSTGAVPIGVAAYKALSAGLKVVCGGLFDGGAAAVGAHLEADNEHNIAVDVIRHQKCMEYSHRFGHSPWRAVPCRK
jgi:hypothetical protein